eukprot:gene11742-11887_t
MDVDGDDCVVKLLDCMQYNADVVLVFGNEADDDINYKKRKLAESVGGAENASASDPEEAGQAGDAAAAHISNQEFAYCHSPILSISSSVLRHAIESTDTNSRATGQWEGKMVIPLPSTTKQQWMQIVPFLYPSAADLPEAAVTWDNLEAVLVLGNKYDMKGLMRQGSAFLKANSSQLDINTGDLSSSDGKSKKVAIVLPGTTKEQWMQIAPFLYPPAADVAEAVVNWDNLEAVLVLGNKYDMKGLMRQGSMYIKENASCMSVENGLWNVLIVT